jgi:hypothetical protein
MRGDKKFALLWQNIGQMSEKRRLPRDSEASGSVKIERYFRRGKGQEDYICCEKDLCIIVWIEADLPGGLQ